MPGKGLEPPRLAARGPKPRVSTNFTIPAKLYYYFNFFKIKGQCKLFFVCFKKNVIIKVIKVYIMFLLFFLCLKEK